MKKLALILFMLLLFPLCSFAYDDWDDWNNDYWNYNRNNNGNWSQYHWQNKWNNQWSDDYELWRDVCRYYGGKCSIDDWKYQSRSWQDWSRQEWNRWKSECRKNPNNKCSYADWERGYYDHWGQGNFDYEKAQKIRNKIHIIRNIGYSVKSLFTE